MGGGQKTSKNYYIDTMKIVRKKVTLLIFFLMLRVSGWAQNDSTNQTSVNVDASFGIGTVSGAAYSLSSEFRIQHGHHLFSLQAVYSREIQFEPILSLQALREQALNISFLYGRTYSFHLKRMLFPLFPIALFFKKEADYSISGSLGAGVINTHLRGTRYYPVMGLEDVGWFTEDRKLSYCIPFQIELIQYFSSSVGYVHRFYYNYNARREYWGFMWGVNVNLFN